MDPGSANPSPTTSSQPGTPLQRTLGPTVRSTLSFADAAKSDGSDKGDSGVEDITKGVAEAKV